MTEYIVELTEENHMRVMESCDGIHEGIVRCRDCKLAERDYVHRFDNTKTYELMCARFTGFRCITEPDGFCAWAERKEVLRELVNDVQLESIERSRLSDETLAENVERVRECEMYRDQYGVWHCKACESGADTDTGSDGTLDAWHDSWPPNYCPHCGAKVKVVDK